MRDFEERKQIDKMARSIKKLMKNDWYICNQDDTYSQIAAWLYDNDCEIVKKKVGAS